LSISSEPLRHVNQLLLDAKLFLPQNNELLEKGVLNNNKQDKLYIKIT